jgi:hypothetical protein
VVQRCPELLRCIDDQPVVVRVLTAVAAECLAPGSNRRVKRLVPGMEIQAAGNRFHDLPQKGVNFRVITRDIA